MFGLGLRFVFDLGLWNPERGAQTIYTFISIRFIILTNHSFYRIVNSCVRKLMGNGVLEPNHALDNGI